MRKLALTLTLALAAAAAVFANGHTSDEPPPIGPDYKADPPTSDGAALADARKYFDEGSYAWAVAAAEELKRRWPASILRAEGDLIALRCYLYLEKPEEADRAFEDYFKLHKRSPHAADAADLLVDAYSEGRNVYDVYGWQTYLGDKHGFYIYGGADDRKKMDDLRRRALKQAKGVYKGLMKNAAGAERLDLADRLVVDYLIMYPFFDFDGDDYDDVRSYNGRAAYLKDVGRLEMTENMRSLLAMEEAVLDLQMWPISDEEWEASGLTSEDYQAWVVEQRFTRARPRFEEIAAAYGAAPGALLARAALAHYEVTYLDEPGAAAEKFDELADTLEDDIYSKFNRIYADELRAPALAMMTVAVDPWAEPTVEVELACRILEEVELTVYRADPHKYLFLQRELAKVEPDALPEAEEEGGQGSGGDTEPTYHPVPTAELPGVGEAVANWTVATGCSADDYRVRGVNATPPVELEPGLYVVEARSGEEFSRAIFLLTRAAAMAATDNEEVFLEFVDARTGAPVPVGDMTAYNIYYKPNEKGYNEEVVDEVPVDPAKRDKGILIDLTRYEKSSSMFFVFGTELGPVVYRTSTSYEARAKDGVTGTIITDRPLYRPGDKVSFKGFIRNVDYVEKVLSPLAGQEIEMVLTAPDGSEVWKETAVTDEYGTAAGEIELPPGIRLGSQALYFKWKEGEAERSVYGTFDLEEYEKPEYEIAVEPAKDRYFSGERVEMNVVGAYYFGAPMAGAAVSYEVHRQGYTPKDYEYDKVVNRGDGTLDAEGRMTIEFDTPWAKRYDNYFNIYLKVTDVSERVVEETGSVSTYMTDRYVTLSTDKYEYRQGETVKVNVWADDWYDDPVSAEVIVEAYEYKWDNRNGYCRGDKLYEGRVTTDEDGEGILEFELDSPPGEVELAARITGTNGAEYEASTSFNYVAGDVETTVRKPEIGISIDERYPTLGDDVQVTLESRFDDAECLITIYSGRIVTVKHIKLEPEDLGSGATFTLTADSTMVPSCYLYASLLRDGATWTANDYLYVTNTDVRMNVEVEAGNNVYRPREEASVEITCTNPAGLPMSADVSLAAVDASLLALRPDRTYSVPYQFEQALGRYGYVQQNDSLSDRGFVGNAVFCFPYYNHYYGTAGTTFLPLDVERWGPGANMLGRIYLPDVTRQELYKYLYLSGTDLLGRRTGIYGMSYGWGESGGYGIIDGVDAGATYYRGGGGMGAAAPTTGTVARMSAMDAEMSLNGNGRFVYEESASEPEALPDAPMAGEKMKRSEDKGKDFAPAEVRKEFADTAYWLPHLEIGASGLATATFELPDNLTDWTVMALALDKGQRFGWGATSFNVNKFIIARLKAPRYFVAGDVARLTAIGHNYLKESKELKLQLEEEGLTGVKGEPSKTEKVDADGKAVLYHWVEASEVGDARIVTSALTDVESDAAELRLPIYPHGTQIRQAFGGRLRMEAAHEFTIAEGMAADTFEGEIKLAPSLAASLSHGLDYFENYPYDCVEQTLNRFRMNALLAAAAADLGLEESKLSDGLTEAIDEGVTRLGEQQTNEGGWPWWKGGRESPYMTAYAVDGLGTLLGNPFLSENSAGRVEEMYAAGDTYLRAYVENWRNDRDRYPWILSLYVADVALRRGILDPEEELAADIADYYFEYRSPHNHMSLALLASILNEMGDEQRLAVILRNLDNGAKIGRDNTLHWGEDPENCWRWWDDSVETTSKVLEVKLAYDPDSAQLPYIVDWLVDQRRGAAWKSTKDSAAATTTLIRYILARPELAAPIVVAYRAGLKDGGVELDPTAYEEPTETVELTAADFAEGPNAMELTRTSGEGPVFYTMAVEYYAEARDLPAVQGSVTLERDFYIIKKEYKKGKVKEKRVPLDRPLELGEEIEVELTINSPYDFDYVVLEDPKAAGFIFLETRSGYNWSLDGYVELWNKQRNVFFERLREGETVVRYRLRAEVPGEYAALPARIYGMYAPDIGSNTASARIEISD